MCFIFVSDLTSHVKYETNMKTILTTFSYLCHICVIFVSYLLHICISFKWQFSVNCFFYILIFSCSTVSIQQSFQFPLVDLSRACLFNHFIFSLLLLLPRFFLTLPLLLYCSSSSPCNSLYNLEICQQAWQSPLDIQLDLGQNIFHRNFSADDKMKCN